MQTGRVVRRTQRDEVRCYVAECAQAGGDQLVTSAGVKRAQERGDQLVTSAEVKRAQANEPNSTA